LITLVEERQMKDVNRKTFVINRYSQKLYQLS